MSEGRVLLVDDDVHATSSLARSLERRSDKFSYHVANSAEVALELASEVQPEVIVVDLTLDPKVGIESGFTLITDLQQLDPTFRILVLTGSGSDESGVRALQMGAASFIEKPAEVAHLAALLQDAVSSSQLRRSYKKINESSGKLKSLLGLSSKNPAMLEALESALYAASTKQPVLIAGETGTGKGLLAQAIHSASKSRGSFLRVQPSFGSADLVASELFGHQKGAFTGATENRTGLIDDANRGTLFIDEVDQLATETQILLLNVLQEKSFRQVGSNKDKKSDFRLLTATNLPIEKLIGDKALREDFYHRVAHYTIIIPPLRERPEDIPDLATELALEISNSENLAVQGITPEALSKLLTFNWPGNVRQLHAVVEGAIYRANYEKSRFVDAEHININNNGSTVATGSFREKIKEYELSLVTDALERNNNNQTKAAESLNLDRTSFRRILTREK